MKKQQENDGSKMIPLDRRQLAARVFRLQAFIKKTQGQNMSKLKSKPLNKFSNFFA